MTRLRGGKRQGAGRPKGSAVLSFEERLEVGVECQERWKAARAENLRAAEEAIFGGSEYARQIAAIHYVPLADRPDFLPLVEHERRPALPGPDSSGVVVPMPRKQGKGSLS